MLNARTSLTATLFVVTLMLGNPQVDAAKIMMIVFQQASHVIMKIGIGVNLISRGHEVHFLLSSNNPMADTVRRNGIQVISYQPASGVLYPYTAEYEDALAGFIFNRSTEVDMLSNALNEDCKTILGNRELIDHIKGLRFDMILLEPFICNPCYLLIPHHLGIRFVTTAGVFFPLSLRVPALPSFYGFMSLGSEIVNFPLMKTFAERLSNAGSISAVHALTLPRLWQSATLLQAYAPGVESWDELMLKSEVILVDNDHLLNTALPLLPHVVTTAGCTARPPQPLPDSLEKIMAQSGDDGVILMSFGTTGYRMPPAMVSKLMTSFGRLTQTVLTRMAIPAHIRVPDNVHNVKWLPQNDILGHPKTKLFITHCGSNGQYEALYHGVPMLGIPMFAEQGWNCARAQHKGIARCLDLIDFTPDELHGSVTELIGNVTYQQNVLRLSAIRRDEPMNGCEKAGYWITHVLKYGSQHLRSPAVDMPLYKLLMLDIIGAVVLAVLGFVAFTSVVLIVYAKKLLCWSEKYRKDKKH